MFGIGGLLVGVGITASIVACRFAARKYVYERSARMRSKRSQTGKKSA